ncbi:hypothetical protein BH09VER1_BH09VER1_40490 [soil metagenome]
MLGLWVGAEICQAQAPAPTKDDQSAKLEARLAELEKEVAGLQARQAKRSKQMPSAMLWVTPDGDVYRTAIPESAQTPTWAVIYNGSRRLERLAKGEYKLNTLSLTDGKPGGYVVYLSSFVDGAYRPISNVVYFYVSEKGKKIGEMKMPEPPVPAEARTLDERISRLEDRLSEWRTFVSQQESLPKTLTVWMDNTGNIRRDVGPEPVEDDICWLFRGPDYLMRNAKAETVFGFFFQKPGQYVVATTLEQEKSNSNRLTIEEDAERYLKVVKDEPPGEVKATP